MANRRHLQILKQGAEAWNEWRGTRLHFKADLSGADLSGLGLSGANLSGANLCGADLSGADLTDTSLIGVDLSRLDLDQVGGGLIYLSSKLVRGANLSGADLSGACLAGTNFTSTDLWGADFTCARLAYTIFADNDLSEVKGLREIKHEHPSYLSIDTIYNSHGKIPEVFLRGCGVPESFIVQMRSLIASTEPIQFYSCFISYSSKDQEFADRLHSDLRAKGIRIWFAPHDMKIGARIRPTIDESIRVYDKLLLVLSEHSVSSQWVEQEVETALRKERQSGGTVLFPVRLDDTVLKAGEGWPALVKDTRHVGDFTHWKDHDSYRKAFDRLLRDLKAET